MGIEAKKPDYVPTVKQFQRGKYQGKKIVDTVKITDEKQYTTLTMYGKKLVDDSDK